MKKKVMILALTFLLFLPAMGFTGDVEVTDVQIKWIKKSAGTLSFRAKIVVTNPTDRRQPVVGRLIFYDREGFEISEYRFSGGLEPGESKVLSTRGGFSAKEYDDIDHYEAIVGW